MSRSPVSWTDSVMTDSGRRSARPNRPSMERESDPGGGIPVMRWLLWSLAAFVAAGVVAGHLMR